MRDGEDERDEREAAQPVSELPSGTPSEGPAAELRSEVAARQGEEPRTPADEQGAPRPDGAAPEASGAPGERTTLIPASERACVWMQVGMLSYWLCDLDYQCEGCPLDSALRHLQWAGDRKRESWIADPGVQVPSRGRTSAQEAGVHHSGDAELSGILDLDLPDLDPHLRYHAAHTWARVQAPDRVRVGIDHFAARIVGPLRCVVLPHAGTRLRRGHPCAWLDQEGGTLTVLAPVSGTMLECNSGAASHPERVSQDPLGAGWLLELEPTELEQDLHRLMNAAMFRRRVAHDVQCWRRRVRRAMRATTPEVGRTQADGGLRVGDVGQLIGPRSRHEIALQFLSLG